MASLALSQKCIGSLPRVLWLLVLSSSKTISLTIMSEKCCPPPKTTSRTDFQTTATRIDVLLLAIDEKLQRMNEMVVCLLHELHY